MHGLRFRHQRQVTNNNIIDYNNRFSFISNNFSQTSAETELTIRNLQGDPNFNIYRIGNRDYLKSLINSENHYIITPPTEKFTVKISDIANTSITNSS